jgi:hypothetical protein
MDNNEVGQDSVLARVLRPFEDEAEGRFVNGQSEPYRIPKARFAELKANGLVEEAVDASAEEKLAPLADGKRAPDARNKAAPAPQDKGAR